MGTGETTRYQSWIDRLQAGDDSALNEMLKHFEGRLMRLSHLMLAEFPQVQRWEQTGDVFQEAMVRLQKALVKVTPTHPKAFLRLAALQIRRELLTLADTYQRRVSPSQVAAGGLDRSDLRDEPSSGTDGPSELATWTEFHEQVEVLEEKLRDVFDLIWYNGLTQAEAAEILKVSERTVRGRWQQARQALHLALSGQLPGR